jgi:UDP-N-acetylglucosamine 1-carboxyvinyltransferase
MDKIAITGGARLSGEIRVSGAKNAALPLLCSALVCRGQSRFKNVPGLNDVRTMGKLLRTLGCEVVEDGDVVTIEPPDPEVVKDHHVEAPYELVKTMRASFLVLGPLLARYRRARVSLPGGCAIGARPIDQHLKGFAAMGATVRLEHGYVECTAESGLSGAAIVLDVPTVTGTENLMMAAVSARGRTLIENAAREPEIEELAHALNKMGAQISGAGTSIISIEGRSELTAIEHAICADRIEAGTFMIAAAITGGELLVANARPEHLDAVIAKLRTSGVDVAVEERGIRVGSDGAFSSLDITTQPYPGFPTDMQAQFMVMAALARGQSVIKEAIFENRFMHVPELKRMGADVHVDGRVAIVRGVDRLSSASVMATDLRASASLVLAGLVAEGRTEVLRVYHLDRGYERIEEKLSAVGADIERIK